MDALTDRQKAILDFCKKYTEDNLRFPPVRAIGNHFGIASTNGVSNHILALAAKGELILPPGETKHITRGIKFAKYRLQLVPILANSA